MLQVVLHFIMYLFQVLTNTSLMQPQPRFLMTILMEHDCDLVGAAQVRTLSFHYLIT